MQDFHFLNNFIFRTPVNSFNHEISDDLFSEALYLSTPVLHNEYQKHLDNMSDVTSSKKINISLYKYKSRASNRCTPFGMFAGLGIGTWADTTKIELHHDPRQKLERKTRLDMNVLYNLAQELAKQDYIRPFLNFYPNNSIYLIANTYRYVEYYYSNAQRFHRINKVDHSDYLEDILRKSKAGLNKEQLSSLIINDDISKLEAEDFIDELIASQLLVNQLEPTLTGQDYFTILLSNIKQISSQNKNEHLENIIELLEEIEHLLKIVDNTIINSIESYKTIYLKLKSILPELSETNLFQTDLYKTTISSTFDANIQEKLKDTLHFLNKITPPGNNKNLNDFKKRFYENYEGNEIPLLIALDTEAGVGYPVKDTTGINDLVEDVYYTNTTPGKDIQWNTLQTQLLKLIHDSIRSNKKVLHITEANFKGVDYSKSTMPQSYSIMFNVLNATTTKLNIGSIGGSSAINLLGRFAGGNEKIHEIVTEISDFEKKQLQGKVVAEIIHLPESRTGNILARPCFREYEIPYLAHSNLDDEFQIKMTDLVLKLVDDTIILFDKRLHKEIIPRLGNAHNYSYNSLPVYHFLCDLQTQYYSKSYLGFSWGELSHQLDFLPRVEYKGNVLQPATWQLKKEELEPFKNKKITDPEKEILFSELKLKIELPDLFLIADGDNELLIDCKNPVAVDVFIDNIKNRNNITLCEYLFDRNDSPVNDTLNNSYTNECIAIVLNDHSQKEQNSDIEKIKIKVNNFISKQNFSIGSEWLYYKIYCGPKTADQILAEKIKPITEQLFQEDIIDKWFFIRYADPETHIRFRIHFKSAEKTGYALQLINNAIEPLINDYLISKIQTDTYKRELERYGDNSIELAEQLFYNDSKFIVDMLDLIDNESGGKIRWKMALRSVDELLNDFHYTLSDKLNLIDSLSASFFNEHGGKKELKLILDQKFRTLKPEIEETLNKTDDVNKEYYPLLEFLINRSISNKPVIDKLFLLNSTKQLQVPLTSLISSLLHMNLDRLFMGRNRTNEFVVYDILSRIYKSAQVRFIKGVKQEKEIAEY